MPGGSGIEVLKFVRRCPELKNLPVIIFTGHQSYEAREQAMSLGANLWLIKPTDFNEIVEIAKGPRTGQPTHADLRRRVVDVAQAAQTLEPENDHEREQKDEDQR